MTPAEAAQKFYAVDSYPFNDAAKGIFHVLSRLSWGNETFAYSNGTLADPSLNANQNSGEDYEYLLELNEASEIIGGEWLNYSANSHPDFLWFPNGKPAADTVTSFGLSYANVTMLLEKSAACSN
ncbi:unnamed protein product [Phytophthora lilii]|nr:unnamed protein product [Phytophthora lilii]